MTKEEAIQHLEEMKKGVFLWDMSELIDLCISALSENKKIISPEELDKIRDYIVDNVVRDPDVFIKCVDNKLEEKNLDVLDVIVGLYDLLHLSVIGENYDYMWHWANKIGFWCDDALLYNRVVKGEEDAEA